MLKKEKIVAFLITVAYSPWLMQVQVFADNNQSSSSSDLEFLPIILPFVVTGGLILQSRTKQKNVSAKDYFNGKVVLSYERDEKRAGQVKTTESAGTALKRKTSKIASAQAAENGRQILGALGDNKAVSDIKTSVMSNKQVSNIISKLSNVSKKG